MISFDTVSSIQKSAADDGAEAIAVFSRPICYLCLRPLAIVDKVAADTQAVLALPEIADALRGQGLEPTGLGADAFAKFIREDLVRWKTLSAELGIRAEN